MGEIVKCVLCGRITEKFRIREMQCNHNQDEVGIPFDLTTMVPEEPVRAMYIKAAIAYHETVAMHCGTHGEPDFRTERLAVENQARVMREAGIAIPFEGRERVRWNEAQDIGRRIIGRK